MSEHLENARLRADALDELAAAVSAKSLNKETLAGFQPWIESSTPEDVALLVDRLVGERGDLNTLKPLVSALMNLFKTPLEPYRYPSVPGNERFLSSLAAENREASRLLDLARPDISVILGKVPGDRLAAMDSFGHAMETLGEIRRHFTKKEHVLFPRFEAAFPSFRCVRLMWSIHEDVKDDLVAVTSLLKSSDFEPDAMARESGKLFFDLHALFFREECVLFPLVAKLLGPESLEAMYAEAEEYGFCFLDDDAKARFESFKPAISGNPRNGADRNGTVPGEVPLDCGSLPIQVISAMLKSLRQDMTFVDAEGRVRYFTNGKHRVFPRSPSIIGRHVGDCHPRESVDRVLRVVKTLESGERDSVEFWLELGGRFVHIEYFAVRDGDGTYLGTLEVSEDLTSKRALTGERRL